MDDKFKTGRVLDLIVLQAKFLIFKCKLQGSTHSITVFEKVIKQRYTLEKFSSFLQNKRTLFDKEGFPYFDLVHDYKVN